MLYTSTRSHLAAGSAEVILQGIAADGGLFVPQEFPHFFPDNLAALHYQQLAEQIFALYLTDMPADAVSAAVAEAYALQHFPSGPAHVVSLGDDKTVLLELWHGPTAAFKDLALQALPRLLLLAKRQLGVAEKTVILVATSGDTGKAALEGFKDVPGVQIIVFYPAGGVSRIQELQMRTTGGSNTHVVGVRGNFDDCQNGVKMIFAQDHSTHFSSANSINWGRLLPQIVYYFYAYGQLEKQGRVKHGLPIDICVPTGNFGNILAAWYAAKMGLPVRSFLCASNENNVLTDAINGGCYDRNRPFFQTPSPSMDILISSNFERFLYDVSGQDNEYTAAAFQEMRRSGSFTIPASLRMVWQGRMLAGFATAEAAFAAIRHVFATYGYLLDPHTAYGYAVAEQFRHELGDATPLLLASTASPFKFPQAVLSALGVETAGVMETALPGLLSEKSGWRIPVSLDGLDELPLRHDLVVDAQQMAAAVQSVLS